MADKLGFKISAEDDSKKAFDSAKKNVKDYKKEITELLKKSKKTDDPFKKMGKSLKGFSKEFNKINQSQKKFNSSFQKTGDNVADTLKNVGREDEVIAQKMAQGGKGMQQSLAKAKEAEIAKQLKKTEEKKSKTQTVNLIKVDKLEVKKFDRGAGGKDGLTKGVSDSLSKQIDKNLSEGLGKVGAGVGMVAGGFIAAIGVAYSVMTAKANAFKAKAQQQMGGLQQLGFGAREGVPGQDTTGGFYSGYRGKGPGGNEFFLTGQQQIEAMTGFAGQTGGNRKQLENMMYGKKSGGLNLGSLTQAYGLNVGQTAGTAGMFERFGGGAGGMQTLIKAMGSAEKVGMGGARIKEFLDAMQEAVSQAVQDGSSRSNAGMLKGLETLMGTNDERLKALAPEILRTSTQTMNQAAMLQGGSQGNFMFQAVMNQMKKEGGGNLFDTMERLASGDWLKNAQAALQEAKKRSGGDEQWTAYNLTKGMGLNVASPKSQQEIARMIEKGEVGGKTLTRGLLEREVSQRMRNTAKMIEETVKTEYVQSLHTLSEANKDAAVAVHSLREAITTIIDKGYELGKKPVERFFGADMGSTYPTKTEY